MRVVDVWWDPGMLSQAADLFDAQPRLAVIMGRTLVGPEEADDPIREELEHSPLPREPGMPGPSLLGFMAGLSVFRRSAFLEAGGFDPLVFISGEEEWLAAELAERGWWMCYVPQLTVHHWPGGRDSHSRRWQVAGFNHFVRADEHGVAGKSRKTLIRRVAITGRAKRQNLPE